jgi:hypothetical protein
MKHMTIDVAEDGRRFLQPRRSYEKRYMTEDQVQFLHGLNRVYLDTDLRFNERQDIDQAVLNVMWKYAEKGGGDEQANVPVYP